MNTSRAVQRSEYIRACGKDENEGEYSAKKDAKNHPVALHPEEDFEKAKTPKDRSIQILHFADLSSIRPIYFDKTYHAVPESGGDKAYELLRKAVLEESKVAIAKTVIGQSEKLLCLIPTKKGILIETLFFYSEVKEMPKEPVHPDLSDAELTMAKTLINSMVQEFQPEQYHDEYQRRLRQIIEAKINGQEIAHGQEKDTSNIMEALQTSLTQVEAEKQPPKKPRGRKKTAS